MLNVRGDWGADAQQATSVAPAIALNQVSCLNFDYLELLVTLGPAHVTMQGLDPSTVSMLSQLPKSDLHAIGRSAYALFRLDFGNATGWPPLHDRAVAEDAMERYCHVPTTPASLPLISFAELAFYFAWHLASVNSLTARVLLGLPEAIVTWLRPLPLWQVRQLALQNGHTLSPRWPANPRFWPDLVRAAARKDEVSLEETHRFGMQLLAAELEPNAIRRGL